MTREERTKLIRYLKYCRSIGADYMITDKDADEIIKALEQLPKLQNRCYALTQGQMCMFCPYDCERRTTAKREVME